MSQPSRILEAASRAPSPAQERNAKVERVLRNITGLRGVTAAAIVDGDGLVTHAQQNFEINVDALGAAVQIGFGGAGQASEHVGLGAINLFFVENQQGLLILAPLVKHFILAVVADNSSLLGSARFEVKLTVPVLNEIFA